MKRRLEKPIEDNFRKSNLWRNKIEQDCKKQNVFLAIRDNQVDLYHKGGRLFHFDGNDFETHLKYAAVITANKKNYLTEADLRGYSLASDFETIYRGIKGNCSKYSRKEASGISCLYHNHSYLSDSNVVVLDVEVSFESADEQKKQDRIDILLFNKGTETLQFVEAKHYSNKEIRSETKPKVISQIERYESQITKRKSEILSEYSEYTKALNRIFSISLPEPKAIEEQVTLLIFGFDDDQKKGRLREQITENPVYSEVKYHLIGEIKQVAIEELWKGKGSVNMA